MSGIPHANHLLGSRDIRRYPSEIDRVPSRGDAQRPEAGHKLTFAKVAAEVNDVNQVATIPRESPAKNDKPFSLWEKESVGFGDFIDIINPLHHIPIVATLYRKFSDDQIGAAPRVIGGALWGRIGGFVSGVVNAVVEWWSGKDIGDHIYAAIFGPSNKDSGDSAVAQQKPTPAIAVSAEVVARETFAPRSAESPAETTVEPPPAAAPENEAMGPAARRSSMISFSSPPAHTALISYAKNIDWDESEEPVSIRFPA